MKKILISLLSIIVLSSQATATLGYSSYFPSMFTAFYEIVSQKSNTDSAWVTEQTSLTGGNNVTISVGNKTTLTGAVIASASDNLTLTTKELEHNDIEDRNTTESKGFGLSTSIGTSQSDKGKTNVAPNGSTTLTLKNTGEEKEQTTKATIGNGTIIISGVEQTENDLQGLNRNTETTQETTKDIITGALDASATIDNRALLGFIKTEVKDKDGNTVYEQNEDGSIKTNANGEPIAKTTTGYQSIANDFKYLPGNAVKATAGALSTAASPLTAIYASITASKNSSENGENTTYDKTDIISVWKANQSANATGILRGSSEEAGTIVEKIKAGKATPEEIQALAKMTADGKSNLMYSEKGELVDNAGKVVLGFNDIKEHQGYVNLGNGAATNALTFALTDAEERAHNYTGNESIAKGAAKSELTYYNAVSWLTGAKTITENNSGAGGYGTLTQLNWNNTYNTSNNTLLLNNTVLANSVSDGNKANALFVNSANKIVHVGDMSDFNAYRVSDDVTEIDKNMEEDYKDEQISYASIFLDKDQIDKMTDKELTDVENKFMNEEVHSDIGLLSLFNNDETVTGTIIDFIQNGGGNEVLRDAMRWHIGNGEADNSLLGNFVPTLYDTLIDIGIRNPMNTLAYLGDFTIEGRDHIAPVTGDVRIEDGGGVGLIGANRAGGYAHQGLDIYAVEGEYVYAPADGKIIRTGQPYETKNGNLKTITIQTANGADKLLYVKPANYIQLGSYVKQGDIIGTLQNIQIESPSRHDKPGEAPTPLHVHIEIRENNNLKDPKDYYYPYLSIIGSRGKYQPINEENLFFPQFESEILNIYRGN
ncbi:M23 family metallopeptidase [Endomicrobium proavitum]|nr:M23 family metallopeptidase [Endomicrobium proavitum]